MTTFDLLDVPAPGPLRLPEVSERTLPNGLRVLATRRASTPLAEVCLSIPFAHADAATAVLLAGALSDESRTQDRARAMGGGLSAAADADRLRIAGSVLADQLPAFLALLEEIVTAPAYPAAEFAITVDNAVQGTIAVLASPAHHVAEALNTRMFGDHPYGLPVPRPEDFRRTDRDAVRALHAERVLPTGACVVLAGDFDPASVLDLVERALGGWQPGRGVPMRRPGSWVPGRSIVDAPGVSQSLLRMALPAPRYDAPDHPALALAAMVFGGYFSSRLVQNIREDKGFSYSPRSSPLHVAQAHLVTVSLDVVTANTAAAVEEVHAELTGMADRPVTPAELDRARRYSVGTLRLRLATLTGLAATLGELDLHGLPLSWLGGHDARLAAVTPDEVTAAARAYLAPERAITVLLCDEERAYPGSFRTQSSL
ncbi:M16 family metallopeptidase [Amycolatopsis kentuckyensis]|uniref:M16 family metallopeptidase n=1 Tax=Amycolatopsis kentuckyensis TaxID=218823 RepID=UPI000A38EF91|nr:pitrilysin family protein [Amycolatopsis kentuckyensis]